jgi:cytochrome c-type biogenesis protein CcmE
MKPKYRRLRFLILSVVAIGVGLTAILYAFNDNLVFFYTPTQLAQKQKTVEFDSSRVLRIGGIVKKGSVKNMKSGELTFAVTDLNADIAVSYRGLIPTLFREGQGVVVQGNLQADGSLIATSILAKHDENYMPREVMEALKASGRWRTDGGYTKRATP